MLKQLFVNNKTQSDPELIERYQNSHDPTYVAYLFQRYSQLIAAIALDFLKEKDAEDAVMEMYEVLLNDLKRYEIRNFSAWLYNSTRNYCLKKKRRLGLKTDVDLNKAQLHFVDENSVQEKRERDEMMNSLGSAVSDLKPNQRKCIELFYWDQKSYKEIEAITGWDLNTVKSHIQNGKRNLKNSIEV